MESIISELAELRARFDALRPVGSEAPTDLQRKYDIELCCPGASPERQRDLTNNHRQ